MKRRVVKSHAAEFAVAPSVSKGDWVVFEKSYASNKDWFVGRDQRGVSGFFPVDWFQRDGDKARAKRDYDGSELSICAGAHVSVIEDYGRWVLVVDDKDSKGWIPEETIE